ncbi:MAG: DUF1934 domain-containing protein [Ruminococcaceae bacterium]|nr:DUF1934 domain-containing protein [Oscillospiraceae bacterium]
MNETRKGKEVAIEILSIQNGQETSVFISDARFKKNKDKYKIEFDGTELCGMPGQITSLEVENERVVKLTTGKKEIFSQMIMEKGVRHCSLRIDDREGPLSMGVSAKRIKSDISENGGTLEVDYSLEFNNFHAGDHSMIVSVYNK